MAGILEGEGTFCINQPTGNRRYAYPCVAVVMTDEDVVRKLHSLVGIGTFCAVKARGKEHHKPAYRWQIQRKNDCFAFARMVYPLMGERRREQIDALLRLEDN